MTSPYQPLARREKDVRKMRSKSPLAESLICWATSTKNRSYSGFYFLNYDEWFSREVDKGLAAADRGEFVEHDDIGKMIDSRYPA
jgi:predicted transcriptional regulator